MDTFKQIGTVTVDGIALPAMQRDDGRIFAGETVTVERPRGADGRQWNAMTMDILKQRIARTLAHR